MTDRTFDTTTYVRVLTDPPSWVVALPSQTLSTVQNYETFGTYGEAVESGYEGAEVTESDDGWQVVDGTIAPPPTEDRENIFLDDEDS